MPEVGVETIITCLQALERLLDGEKDQETAYFYERALNQLCEVYVREHARGNASLPLKDVIRYDYRDR